ncbi:MAG: fibronectin type III domain-containing protein [Victivallaceae bacterium]|nr:fibronectin type III domain-containing protein [Victivallaceae bacterium]
MKKSASNILKMTVTLLIATVTTLTYALPAYDDVLLVINDNSPQSIEIGNYFQQQRKLPLINVCHIRTKDAQLSTDVTQMTPEAEASAINAIRNYLVNNNLEDKINYIVLTRGIPYWATHIEQSGTRHLFDLQLLTSLADLKYGSGSIFKFNPFYYYITENFENLVDYKFTKAKYGYYIVTRLDGPGVSGVKQQIDSSGYPAYHAYDKDNIKYMPIPPKFRTTGFGIKKPEIDKRTNIKIVYPSAYDNNSFVMPPPLLPLPGSSGLLQRDVATGISFAYFDWVGWEDEFTTLYSNSEASAYYPSPYRGIEFLPGGVAEAFRSHPALYMNRYTGGVIELNPANNTFRDFKKYYTGNDLRFRHLTNPAYDPINNWVWNATGDSPFDEGTNYGDSRVSDEAKQGYAKHRGGGIGIFDVATGKIVKHFSPDSTAFYTPDPSGLTNARVQNIVYDKYAKVMWIAHYEGIQYYDLKDNTWHSIPELTNDFASAPTIYVDPYDTDKVYFSFYYEGGSRAVVQSQIPDAATHIFEYSKSSQTVKQYKIKETAGVIPLLTKTAADTLWLTWGKNLIKYDLKTESILQEIDLVDATQYETFPVPILYPRGLVSTVNSRGEKIVCVAFTSSRGDDANPQKGYILNVLETGVSTAVQTLVHEIEWEFGKNSYQWVQALVKDPASPNTFYLGLGGRRGGGFAFKSTDGRGAAWTVFKPAKASLNYLLGMTVGENGKVYVTRGSYLAQQIIGDFIMDGAVAVGGGMVHDAMYYDENDHSNFVRPPVVARGAYSGNQGEGRTAQTQVEAMMFMILDGYSIADARFGIFETYLQHGGGGHNSHMLTMPPKCAPFAPRVDVDNTEFEVANKSTITIKLHSPGLIASMDGFFASTINSTTVKVFDQNMQPVAPTDISYDSATQAIIITGTFPGQSYYVTLKCGSDGIKNIKGAPLLNTRKDEFKDAITYTFGDAIAPTIPIGLASTINNDFSVYLDWQDSTDAGSGVLKYEVQVDDNANFLNPKFSDDPVVSHTTTSNNLPDSPYFWRVRAIDVAGNYSGWSQVNSFMLDRAGNSFDRATLLPLDATGNASTNGWVGTEDPSDYFKIIPAASGTFDISLTNLSAKIKASIYSYDEIKQKYKRIVDIKTDTKTGITAVNDILLQGDKSYYVVIESADKGKGKENTTYQLDIMGNYFPPATDNNSFEKATNIVLDEDETILPSWVGFGDAADYYKFSPKYNGMFDISMNDMTTKVKCSIYMYDAVKNKYKRIVTLKLDKKTGEMTTNNTILYSGKQYFAVIESADGGKGKYNTAYSLAIKRNGYF